MNLIHNIIPIYLLLELSIAMRNFHFPHYYHGHVMQHDYQHYDSYSSDGRVMRTHRKKHHHRRPNSDYSDSHNWEPLKRECRCSCTQCNKVKLKSCCKEFCSTQCGTLNNLIVVPYPVPFVVLNQSEPSTTTVTTTTAKTSTSTMFPESRKTLAETLSTLPYYPSKYKRFRIVQDKKMRRNMEEDMLNTPKFDKLPKYGIVPIPEKLAMSLMQQMQGDKKNQLQQRLRLGRNIMEYGEIPFT